jgi:mono/diheme cytochrome c family protein
MTGLRFTLMLSAALGGLGFAQIVRTEPESAPPSSWTTTVVRPDPSLTDPALRRGKEVFQSRCLVCHGDYPNDMARGSLVSLPPMPGTQALQAKYQGEKPAVLDQRTDLTPELVAVFVRNGSGPMPFFRPTELSDEDLDALGAYLSRKRR